MPCLGKIRTGILGEIYILIIKILNIILLVVLLQPVFAQQGYWHLTKEDGLPSNTIYDIVQDEKGYMWFGTSNGLVRFDGKEIKEFDNEELKDNEFVRIEALGTKIFFLNLSGQLGYFDDLGNCVIMSKLKVQNFYIDNDDMISVLSAPQDTTVQNLKWLDENLAEVDSLDYLNMAEIFQATRVLRQDNAKNILYLSLSDICLIKNRKILNPKRSKKNIETWKEIEVGFSEKGTSYLSTYSNILYVYNSIENELVELQLPEPILHTHEIDGKTIVKNIENEFFIINHENEKISFSQIYFKLEEIVINNFYQDIEDNIWLITNNGIYVYGSQPFLKNAQWDKKIICYHINEIDENVLFFGGNGKYVVSKENDWIEREIKKKLKIRTSVFEKDVENKVFAGDCGIYRLDKNFNPIEISPKGVKFMERIGEQYFFGTHSGFYEAGEFNVKQFETNLNQKISGRANAFLDMGNGELLLSNTDGLILVNDKIHIPKEHFKSNISSLKWWPDGKKVLIATLGDGLWFLNEKNQIYPFKDIVLPSASVTNIIPTNDFLYVETPEGLVIYNYYSGESNLINAYDGLPSNEITAFYKQDSTLWIGTSKGIVSFNESQIRKNETPIPIHIRGIAIWNKDTTLSDEYKLKYNQNNIQINYVGLGYRCRGNVEYKYRMLGIGEDWQTTDSRTVTYPILPPGKYEFQVKAINEDEVESEKPATLKFHIAPPWWQTWWFYILTGLTIGGIVAFFVQRRISAIQKENEFHNQINNLRMQALQSQMNPHFIFNALNAIQSFFTTKDEESAMIYLARFARLIRIIFHQSKEERIPLIEEKEFLELYLELEQLRFEDKIEADFKILGFEKNSMEFYSMPPLIIQPIIENAFKHGLMHKTSGGELKIILEKNNSDLYCTIEDNGVGREEAIRINQWRRGNHKSSGLITTIERLSILYPKKEEKYYFKITDLKDDAGNALGTRIWLRIPLEGEA